MHELPLVLLDPEVVVAAVELLALAELEELDELPQAASATAVAATPNSAINLGV
jgi:hypothetical protein